jgi:hypothetical protein
MGNVNHVVAETYIQRSKSKDIPTQRGVPMFLGPDIISKPSRTNAQSLRNLELGSK